MTLPEGYEFRPVNPEDFSRRAKVVQKLLGLKLWAARELLARIYGYRNSRDLRASLNFEGTPGPFDDDFGSPKNGLAETRRTHLEKILSDCFGDSAMSDECNWIRNIGLFSSHSFFYERKREAFEWLKKDNPPDLTDIVKGDPTS